MKYLILILLLSSCRTASFHFDKFQKKGGKITCEGDTVIREITTTIKGQDGRIDTIINRVPYVEYLTRWQTKYKYKLQRDSIEVIKYETKYKYKTNKVEVRSKSRWWIWLIVGAVVGFVARRLLKV